MAIWTNYTSKSTPADNDTLLEYDATGRALKQTPFSGVYNWLQAKIHALTASTGAWASSTDKLLTDRNGTLSRIDYSVLAKAIVEEYTGSSVAGANQAIKTALDSLNSKSVTYFGNTVTDFNTIKTPGAYSASAMTNTQNGPSRTWNNTASGELIVYYRASAARVIQLLYVYGYDEVLMFARNQSGESTWNDWKQLPTRAEMDAVTNKIVQVTWGNTVTFNCTTNHRFVIFAGADTVYTGINYSDRLTFSSINNGTEGITMTAARDGAVITVNLNVSANLGILIF